MSDKSTYYRPDWEDVDQFPDVSAWVARGKDKHHFSCKICHSGSLKLSNGITVLRSHMKPSKEGVPKTKH